MVETSGMVNAKVRSSLPPGDVPQVLQEVVLMGRGRRSGTLKVPSCTKPVHMTTTATIAETEKVGVRAA